MRNHKERALLEMSQAVGAYLRSRYGRGDKTWHPLFTACRELFCYLMERA